MTLHLDINDAAQQVRRDDTEIRERLLNSLGIFFRKDMPSSDKDPSLPQPSPLGVDRSRHCALSKITGTNVLEENYAPTPPPPSQRKSTNKKNPKSLSPIRKRPIQYLQLLDYSTQHKEPLCVNPQQLFQPKKKIQFFPQVNVVTVPSHRQYPKHVRNLLWSSLEEIQVNGERNAIEFEADNRDWRKCTECNEFIGVDGELYHPVTYRRLKSTKKLKKKKKGKRKKRRGNIPRKSVQTGGMNRAASKGKRDRLLVSKSTPSLTRFADT